MAAPGRQFRVSKGKRGSHGGRRSIARPQPRHDLGRDTLRRTCPRVRRRCRPSRCPGSAGSRCLLRPRPRATGAVAWTTAAVGVRVSSRCPLDLGDLPEVVGTVVVDDPALVERWRRDRWRVVAEVRSLEEARRPRRRCRRPRRRAPGPADAVGTTGAYVLGQQVLGVADVPVWVQGGIGRHTAAAAIAGGATGVVVDAQTALLPSRRYPAPCGSPSPPWTAARPGWWPGTASLPAPICGSRASARTPAPTAWPVVSGRRRSTTRPCRRGRTRRWPPASPPVTEPSVPWSRGCGERSPTTSTPPAGPDPWRRARAWPPRWAPATPWCRGP